MLLANLFNMSVPETIPEEMQKVADGLSQSPDKSVCLKNAYDLLTGKYQGNRIKTYTKFTWIFNHDIDSLWEVKGYMHCTNINYVLKILLVKSGFFQEEDIRPRWTQIWYCSPHQYLQVNIEGRWTDVDVWAHIYGIPFGDHGHGFH